jgi:hypothetical protein
MALARLENTVCSLEARRTSVKWKQRLKTGAITTAYDGGTRKGGSTCKDRVTRKGGGMRKDRGTCKDRGM